MNRPLIRPGLKLLASVIALVTAVPAHGQGQQRGDASLHVEFQFIRTGKFISGSEEFDYWTTDSQVAMISGDYALNERWSVFATLPYVRKRFNSEVPWGGDPHNPNDPYWVDFVPPDKRFWDDGDYHGDFQDFSLGFRYSVRKGPWTLIPFISYGVPTTDYPFFAKAAIGKNLWTIPVGLSFGFVPYFSDWHFSGNVTHVFSEKPLGYNVDYWLVHLSAGYWFRADLSVNAFLGLKDGNGIRLLSEDFLVDGGSLVNYPADFDTREWWNHDRLLGNENLNFGIGVDYFFTPEWKLSGTGFRSVWTDESTEIDFAYTLGLTRYFGSD